MGGIEMSPPMLCGRREAGDDRDMALRGQVGTEKRDGRPYL
jgi:hypothetical protein